MGENHLVNIAAGRRLVGIGKGLGVLRLLLGPGGRGVSRLADFLLENDLGGSLRAHDGDFGRRPGKVEVGPDVLGIHHVVGAAVGLARNDRDARNRGLAERIQQLGAVHDDAVPLLVGSGQESGHVFEDQQRNIERVAEAHKARSLGRCVNVEHPGQKGGLVGHDADRAAREARKAHEDVLGVVLVDLIKAALIDEFGNDLVHVVGLLGALGHHRVELGAALVASARVGKARNPVHVVLRQVTQKRFKPFNRRHPVGVGKVRDAALGGVGRGSAKLL